LTLAQLRGYAADHNPAPQRFPDQDAAVTPLARLFAQRQGTHPYAPPTAADLFAFAEGYASELGRDVGQTEAQRPRPRRIRFDLELKRVPFRPAFIGDAFTGDVPALLERRLVDAVRTAGVIERTTVRSFDHRAVLAVRRLEPRLTTAVLVAGTAPVAPARWVQQADAQVYAPDFEFLDQAQVREAHAAGIRVVPWTVNEPDDWLRLLDWGVDGLTTDFPYRLATVLQARGIAY